jgi:hypothetical protein
VLQVSQPLEPLITDSDSARNMDLARSFSTDAVGAAQPGSAARAQTALRRRRACSLDPPAFRALPPPPRLTGLARIRGGECHREERRHIVPSQFTRIRARARAHARACRPTSRLCYTRDTRPALSAQLIGIVFRSPSPPSLRDIHWIRRHSAHCRPPLPRSGVLKGEIGIASDSLFTLSTKHSPDPQRITALARARCAWRRNDLRQAAGPPPSVVDKQDGGERMAEKKMMAQRSKR